MRNFLSIFAASVLSTAWAAPAFSAGDVTSSKSATPLTGRVETFESAEPVLPADVLNGGASTESQNLPAAFKGKWYGTVKIARMSTYEQSHRDRQYAQQFIHEIVDFFHPQQRGHITLQISPDARGGLKLDSSDVVFSGGVSLQLTTGKGPALVRGGFNLPHTVRDRVTQFADNQCEQARFDAVTIVDKDGKVLQTGFTEVSALYTLKAPRRMQIKLLDIDYDESGHPLWKALLEGEATR